MIISATPSARHRVLLVAFACHPDLNMETRIGWNRAIASAKEYDTTVIHSAEFSSEELTRRATAFGVDPTQIRFVSVKTWLLSMPSFCDALYWTGYRAWHDTALQVAMKLHRETPFDLVHLVSYCGYREPGQWWKLEIPFIWGPVGGTQNFPTNFLHKLSPASSIREAIRNRLNTWQLYHSRRIRLAAQKAATVFAASSEAQRDMLRGTGVHCKRLLETAVSPLPRVVQRELDTTRPFRILWSGRLREWKGFPLLLEALAQLPATFQFELRVMGVGGSERRWRRLAGRLRVSDSVQWIGWPSYTEGLKHYSWADAFVFTSLRDTSGTGLLESLAAGTPIIGVDHQGARDIMTPQCSVPVSVSSSKLAVAGIAQALQRLSSNPMLWRRLSDGAVARARYFSWERLSDEIDLAYQSALEAKTSVPSNWLGNRRESLTTTRPPASPIMVRSFGEPLV